MWVGFNRLILIQKYMCLWTVYLYYVIHNYSGKDLFVKLSFCCQLTLQVKFMISRWFSALLITWILLTIFIFATDYIFSTQRMCLWLCEANGTFTILKFNNQGDDKDILGRSFITSLYMHIREIHYFTCPHLKTQYSLQLLWRKLSSFALLSNQKLIVSIIHILWFILLWVWTVN